MTIGIIIKISPERDAYLIWSNMVEAPVFAGTRDELVDHLTTGWREQAKQAVLDRLARADAKGSSALYPSQLDPDGGWNDKDGFIYKQEGWLPRSRLEQVYDRLIDGNFDMADLLDPFDD